MKSRRLIRGEKHHWWPACISKLWANEDGIVHRITSNGYVQPISPNKLARISDGHNIVVGKEGSPFDGTFEHEFDDADTWFPAVVNWLDGLKHHTPTEIPFQSGYYFPQNSEREQLSRLCVCLVSLAIRSPTFRNETTLLINSLMQSYKPGKKELKTIMAANMVGKLKETSESLFGSGKFIVLFSDSVEFIFGDGFYHNISMNGVRCSPDVRILMPLTPTMAVLYVRPMVLTPEPRIMTRLAERDLVELINETVQVYSREYLFYRSDKPELREFFVRGEHLVYSTNDPIDNLVDSIPGVQRFL